MGMIAFDTGVAGLAEETVETLQVMRVITNQGQMSGFFTQFVGKIMPLGAAAYGEIGKDEFLLFCGKG
jgi:hypothetical protein